LAYPQETIIDFLGKKGEKLEDNPMAKIEGGL
jgi:hypothetical protein